MTDDETQRDIVGPSTGGTPTAAGTGDPIDREEAASDEDVARLIENLRADDDRDTEVRAPADEAAEEVGTGTDR